MGAPRLLWAGFVAVFSLFTSLLHLLGLMNSNE